jgi:hypothetical protein
LGVAEDRTAVDVRDRLRYQGVAAHEVQVTHPECGHLAVPDAGVGEEQEDESVAAGGLGQLVDLLAREEDLVAAHWSDERHADRRVAGQSAVAHRKCEDQRENAVRLAH